MAVSARVSTPVATVSFMALMALSAPVVDSAPAVEIVVQERPLPTRWAAGPLG